MSGDVCRPSRLRIPRYHALLPDTYNLAVRWNNYTNDAGSTLLTGIYLRTMVVKCMRLVSSFSLSM